MFKNFTSAVNTRFKELAARGMLFRVGVEGSLFNHYLTAYGDDPKFRDPASSEHNCTLCHNFLKRYGNIVAVDENFQILTMFGNLEGLSEVDAIVAEALDNLLKKSEIVNVFVETFDELKNTLKYEDNLSKTQNSFLLGVPRNLKEYSMEEVLKFKVVEFGKIYEFNHFHINVPAKYIDQSGRSEASIMNDYRSKMEVFRNTLEMYSLNTLEMVRDWCSENILANGETYLHSVTKMLEHYTEWLNLFKEFSNSEEPTLGELEVLSNLYKNSEKSKNWIWIKTFNMPGSEVSFKNTQIGATAEDIELGVKDIDTIWREWNFREDPENKHNASKPITSKQKAAAEKYVIDNGYLDSFDRCIATLDDIKAHQIVHINRTETKKVAPTIFDNIPEQKGSSSNIKRELSNVTEMHIDKFMRDVVGKETITSIELFLANNLENNLFNLTTAKNKDSKPIFKYPNNFSLAFKGNLTGRSKIREAVESRGGKTSGVLRFSMMWAEDNWATDNSDLDAHCQEPNGNVIYFSSKVSPYSKGELDVDIQTPSSYSHKSIVENITFDNIKKMADGKYLFFVRNFKDRGSKGVKCEVAVNGETYSYIYEKPIQQPSMEQRRTGKICDLDIKVATVTLSKGVFTIEHHLPELNSEKDLWGLKSNNFYKVNLVALSPNQWGDTPVGVKHYLFGIEGLKNPEKVRGFFNADLIPDLLAQKNVMNALGATNLIEPSDDQLAGVAFNTSIAGEEVIVKLKGSYDRVIKIIFN